RLHVPRDHRRRELGVEDVTKILAQRGVLDRYDDLDATLEVALHAVGRADQVFLVAPVPEIEDPAVLEEASEDADHADPLGDARDAGPQATRVAHDQVDAHARA